MRSREVPVWELPAGRILRPLMSIDADLPTEAFLAAYPIEVPAAAETLRGLVRRTVPAVVERIRPGWRLVGTRGHASLPPRMAAATRRS